MSSTVSPIPPAVLINVIMALLLLSPDHKNAVHFGLALWGCLLWEPSLCAVRKLKRAHMERLYGETLRLNDERGAKSLPSIESSAVPAPATICMRPWDRTTQPSSSWIPEAQKLWKIKKIAIVLILWFTGATYFTPTVFIMPYLAEIISTH